MPKLERIHVPNDVAEVIVNDRGSFTIKAGPSVPMWAEPSVAAASAISADPDRFLRADFVAASLRLNAMAQEIENQRKAIITQAKDRSAPGLLRSVLPGTVAECERLLADFRTTLLPFVAVGGAELRRDVELPGGRKVPSLAAEYYMLFGQGRWLELVAKLLIARRQGVRRGILLPELNIRGRSTLWHQVDVLLVTPDISVMFEAKTALWGRDELLKLIAETDDAGVDWGVLLTLHEASNDFEPVSGGHPVVEFNLAGAGLRGFEDWLNRLFPIPAATRAGP